LPKNVSAPLLSSHWFCVYTCEYYTAFNYAHNKFNVADWDTTMAYIDVVTGEAGG